MQTGDTHDRHPPPPPPSPHTQTPPPRTTMKRKRMSQQCCSVCGASAEIGVERKPTNARVHTTSTRPNTDVLWCEQWHHSADRIARRWYAPRPSPDVAARPAAPNPIRRLSGRKGELALRHVVRAFACDAAPIPPHCARHSTVCASALCAADGSRGSRATCSLRPAGATVRRGAQRGRPLQLDR